MGEGGKEIFITTHGAAARLQRKALRGVANLRLDVFNILFVSHSAFVVIARGDIADSGVVVLVVMPERPLDRTDDEPG